MLLLAPLVMAAPSGGPSVVTVEGPYVYTATSTATEATPARFSAPLPVGLQAWSVWGPDAPPRGVVVAELCNGDDARWGALVDAAGKAVAAGDLEAEVYATYGAPLTSCTARVCTKARAIFEGGGHGAGLASWALQECPDVADLYAKPEVPDEPLVAYWAGHSGAPEAVRRRAAEAVTRFLATRDPISLGSAVEIAAGLDDPAVAQTLLDAGRSANNGYDRRTILRVLGRFTSPDAQAAFKAFCKEEPDDTACTGAAPVSAPAAPKAAAPSTPFASLDVPPGVGPAALLTSLASLGGDALNGVRFDEVAPAEGAGAYTLLAWMDGQRYTVVAEDDGDGYDLAHVLGFLDTLARTRKRPERWVALPAAEGRVTVLAAPAPALDAAVVGGLNLAAPAMIGR